MAEKSLAERGCAVVVGAGSGTGAEVAKGFARAGYPVVVARRDAAALEPLVKEIEEAGGRATAHGVDAADEKGVEELFASAEKSVGPVEIVVFNASGFGMRSILETTGEEFEQMWRVTTLGGFLVGREAARRMVPRERGTILFTGATASVKASARFAAFAAGKHGLRAVALSMARELGPKGIHVAHVVVDAIIDVPRVHEAMPEVAESKGPDGLLSPQSIAAAYLWIHQQSRDAWTFELDLRPFCESW